MIKKCLLLLLLVPCIGYAQTFTRGLIMPSVDSLKFEESYCCVLSPAKGFSVYDSPNGKIIGTLKRLGNVKEDDQAPYKIYLVSGAKKIKVNQFEEIDYDLYAIKYTDSVNGFIMILDTLNSNWLNVDELKQQGFKPVRWMDYMINTCREDLSFYPNEPGLRLRKEPNASSELIGSVRGTLFKIKLSGECSGQWNKVKVIKLKQDPCDGGLSDEENIEYQMEGWLKVLDDRGEPNLWRYTRGC
jgi:hypothetical protein